jgi:RNA-directed DNA polymerase
VKPSRVRPNLGSLWGREGPNGKESETHVNLGSRGHQKSGQLELPFDRQGETLEICGSGELRPATNESGRSGNDGCDLMAAIIERSNVEAALRRVKKNKGSPGVDGMTTGELTEHVADHWGDIREQLLAGVYQPKPVLRRAIPKKGGGVRELGIPCAIDRVIQQCILQVLQPRLDPSFSEHSYGFRPGRSAHHAICAAQRFIQEGRRWVVDVDLEKFFDRVNHDVLMAKLARRIEDRRLLGLIRRYLEAGVMALGVTQERHEGTPQGGPLSPLLANVLLDEIDKELERRGHAFVRYADDCNVYVRSQRAGERVMASMRKLFAALRLRINETKSAVARPWDRKFLAYTFKVGEEGTIQRWLAPQALKAMKDRIRSITRRNGGQSIGDVVRQLKTYLPGWKAYFRLVDTPFIFELLDGWIRRRLRALHLKHWKTARRTYRALTHLGLSERKARGVAACVGSWWKSSGSTLHVVLNARYFDTLGVPRLKA